MMTVMQIYEFLNRRVPQALSAPWDNDGLMCCPDPDRPVSRVLCALDVTQRVIDCAVTGGYAMIVSHHPLIFKPVAAINPEVTTAKKLIKLIQNGVAVLSFHTRLDALPGGVNDRLAALLGLLEAAPFGPEGEQIGRIGQLAKDMPLAHFAAHVKAKLGAPAVLYADGGRPVRRVAALGGDGKDFVMAAAAAGADTFVTGRAGYNVMVEAPALGLNLIEAGHFYTEDVICGYFAELLREADPTLEVSGFSSNEIRLI